MGLLDFLNKKTVETMAIVDRLEQMGYFKYADAGDIEALKREVGRGLNKEGDLSTIFEKGEPFHSKDYRHYSLDGESLYETGGFVDALNELQPFLEKISFKMSVAGFVEQYDEVHGWINSRIAINGKEYIIFKDFNGDGWSAAPLRFAGIVNDQFAIHGIEDRVYLFGSGNEGRFVLLTEEQYRLLDPILKHPYERPLTTTEWCRVLQIKPEDI